MAFDVVLQGLCQACIRGIDSYELTQNIEIIAVDGNVKRIAVIELVRFPEHMGMRAIVVRLQSYQIVS